jgi:hypothetical protein
LIVEQDVTVSPSRPEPTLPRHFAVAPLDTYATRITTGVSYLGGLLMLPLLFAYLSNLRWGGLLIPVALAVALALFLLLAYATQPTSYEIAKEELIVRRRWWWALRVPLHIISGVSAAASLAHLPQRGLRFAFNPGVFGYHGPFYLAPYGTAFFAATNRERLVSVARHAAPPLIISPERPGLFVESMHQQMQQRSEQDAAPTTNS